MRLRTLLSFIMVVIAGVWLITAAPTLAAPEGVGASAVCSAEGLLQGRCGDRVCDAYRGENATSCPIDCAPPTRVPTNTPTPVPSATPTGTVPPVVLPQRTSVPIRTATASPTASATAVPTATGTEVTVKLEPTSEATEEAMVEPGFSLLESIPEGCRFVDYDLLTDQWQRDLSEGVWPANYRPAEPAGQEVLLCDQPVSGEVCLPLFDNVVAASNGSDANIALAGCSAEGVCTTLTASGEHPQGAEDVLCFDVSANAPISCQFGCVLSPQTSVLPSLPLGSLAIWLPIGLLVMLIGGGILILFLLTRRRRDERQPATQTPRP